MPDLLKKYRTMRDFGETPEPAGGKPKKTKLPIFVIQKHQASHLHYDFRLEMEGVLKSWAVPKGPSYDPNVKRLAMMTEDHPYDYAGFEGVIPEGNYGAGNVIVWDNGTWEFIEPGDDPVKALASGKLTFRLNGKKMFGEWALVRIRGRSPKGNEWLLLKHRDKYANDDIDVTEVAPRSIISNRLVEEVDPKKTWQSNRPASSRRPATMATRLAAEEREKTKSRTGTARKASPAKKKAAAAPKPAARSRAAAKSRRSPAAPARAASARSRSSPAGSPAKARPTRRRQPR
jgi:bifunctional non-homologous end joining protein LigD